MKKKIVAACLAIVSALSVVFSGCGGKIPAGPDYSDSTKQFDFYGYSALIDGWNIDGEDFDVEEDYLSVERIKEYKDAGMTIYFPQSAAVVNDTAVQNWETSAPKRALDYSAEAGIDKVILFDNRISGLTKKWFYSSDWATEKNRVRAAKEDGSIYQHKDYGLVGEGKQFATEADLDAYVAQCMAPYKDHPSFYGVMLGDEPFFYHAKSYGEMYRSIKRVCPDAYIQYNLNPITAGEETENREARFPTPENESSLKGMDKMVEAYKAYVKLFMDETGAEYIQYDAYPLYSADEVEEYYIVGLQTVAELAKEYDAEFYFVTQTFNMTDGSINRRKLTQEDLYWLNNMLLGFGIKQVSYFTYFTKADNNSEHFKDGQSFLTWEGEKTDIYTWMQQIMREEQKFAPVILSFDYVTSKVYRSANTTFNSSHVLMTLKNLPEFKKLTELSINKECALVTELYDAEKDNYMYMLQNVIDPAKKGSKAYQTIEATFSGYEYAALYEKGECRLVKLEDGKLTLKQRPGVATYVIPY